MTGLAMPPFCPASSFFPQCHRSLQLGPWPLETVTELAGPDNPRGTNFLAASPSAALPTRLVLVAHAVPWMRQEPSRLCCLRGPILLRAAALPLPETPGEPRSRCRMARSGKTHPPPAPRPGQSPPPRSPLHPTGEERLLGLVTQGKARAWGGL